MPQVSPSQGQPEQELLVQQAQRELPEPLDPSVCLLLDRQGQPVTPETLEPKAIPGQLVLLVQALQEPQERQDRPVQRELLAHKATPEPQLLALQERLELQVQPELLVPQA